MKKRSVSFFLLLTILLPGMALATPSQYGITGLVTVPTADTLDSGNLAVGLWLNTSSTDTDKDITLLPVSLTMGLGTFMEAYASFPSLLFNNDEPASGRGYANLGMKIRVLGKRSSPIKFSLDIQARRHVDNDVARDGLTDLMGRGIASFKTSRLGLHLNAGYLTNDNDSGLDDQVVAGVGLEFYPMARLRILVELDGASEPVSGQDQQMEALLGFQYFISPHLTFHSSYGMGLSDTVNDSRIIAGFSTSQGIGTYTKPVPRIIEAPDPAAKKEPVKKARFKALTPLVPKMKALAADPVSKLEIPLDPEEETVIVEPSELLVIPGTAMIKGAPVSPIASPMPAPSLKEIPVEEVQIFKNKIPIETVVYKKFRFDELSYGFNQAGLSAAGIRSVALVADKLRKENKKFLIRVNGHTDSTGSDLYNEKLGYERAVSVAIRLVLNEGFDPSRVFVKGLGEKSPIADNSTPEGRSSNRRSEILVLIPK